MAKPPKKQPTTKTPEQAMNELTELSQELGLYDITGNPLLKDDTIAPLEASTEALEPFADETNATVAQELETSSSIATESLNATDPEMEEFKSDLLESVGQMKEMRSLLDKITEENKHEELTPTVEDKFTLKDGQGKPIPTKLVVIQSMNYTDLVSQALFAGYLGSQLDRSFRILSTVPFRIRVLMPEDQYENFLSKESQVVFDENLTYNKVLVKAFDLYTFWKNIIKVGKDGAMLIPREVVRRKPLMAPCYMRMPIADTPESRVGNQKVQYTKAELESFSLASLLAAGSWYGLNSNSKLKLIRGILEAQGN